MVSAEHTVPPHVGDGREPAAPAEDADLPSAGARDLMGTGDARNGRFSASRERTTWVS
jgi:hypothetical protein